MRSAITSLYEVWGLGPAEIAQALGVTQRVARLARDGRETADGAHRLDEFLWQLRGRGVDEPGAWMTVPVVDGWTVTRWHLYAGGRLGDLLDNAAGLLGDVDLLDRFDPDWRRTYWTSYKTVEAADGGRSVVGKSYDEIRAQMQEDPR